MRHGDNRHPADEIAEVRGQIAELKKREGLLREQLIGSAPNERRGDFYRVHVLSKTRRVLNTVRLEDEVGDISGFYDIRAFTLVTVDKLK